MGNDGDWTVSGNNMYSAVSANVGIGTTNPKTILELASGYPYLTLRNITAENANFGGESEIIFKGEMAGGGVSSLGILKFSHEGTGYDDNGRFEIKVNTGYDGDSPPTMFSINSYYGTAIGYQTTANGSYSVAMGYLTEATTHIFNSNGYRNISKWTKINRHGESNNRQWIIFYSHGL